MLIMPSRTAYFHEDDYCQIELLPAQNWTHCAQELGRIGEICENHTEGELGWSEICVRTHAPLPIAALGIDFSGTVSTLSRHLPPFDQVQTGYASHVEHCPQTLAFGFDKHNVIFMSHNGEKHVNALWLLLEGLEGGPLTEFMAALHALDTLGPLLLVDWAWNALLRLRDTEHLLNYLGEHAVLESDDPAA